MDAFKAEKEGALDKALRFHSSDLHFLLNSISRMEEKKKRKEKKINTWIAEQYEKGHKLSINAGGFPLMVALVMKLQLHWGFFFCFIFFFFFIAVRHSFSLKCSTNWGARREKKKKERAVNIVLSVSASYRVCGRPCRTSSRWETHFSQADPV